MKVIQADNGHFRVFEVNEDGVTFICFIAELNSSRTAAGSVSLLLDHPTYFDPMRQAGIFSQVKIRPNNIYSPYEAAAAYLKSQNPAVNGNIQVLDLEGGQCWLFTAGFEDGRYKRMTDIGPLQNLALLPLFERYFQRDILQMVAFDQFLMSVDPSGKYYGLSVWEAMRAYEHGNQSQNNIIEIFDVEEWADITISQLLAFKQELLGLASVSISLPHTFIGLLAPVLSTPSFKPSAGYGRLLGVRQLYHNGDQFFANCPWPVSLEVFCYPDPLVISLYPGFCRFEEYTQPKKIRLFDTGSFTLYKDKEPLRIGTGTKTPCWNNIEIRLDGNQKFLVTTGSISQLV